MKNGLLEELIDDIYVLIKETIGKNYDKYLKFLIDTLKRISTNFDKSQKTTILFDSEDYSYFLDHFDEIQNFFGSKIELKQIEENIAGGFKIMSRGGLIYYDFSLNNLIEQKSASIQIEFSKFMSDTEIKKLENNFSEYIQNKKLEIQKYLTEYDRI